LFHVSGLYSAAVAHLAGGVKSVWTVGRFDPGAVLSLIEREQVTGWAPQGAIAWRVIHHPDLKKYDVSSVRTVGGGGAPVPAALQAALREAFPNARYGLGVGYGLTEGTALATINTGAEIMEHPDSVGRPIPTVEIEIRDESGQPVPDGGLGEITLRGPLVMREYWRNPEATAAVILPGRWLRTGDIGRMQDGRLFLATRMRDLILRGAENVYPIEIENRLAAHPAVGEAAVIGVSASDPALGQEVKAIVVPKPGAPVDFEELGRWVGETLAYFKVPSQWELRSEPLPRNASGKVLKYLLQDGAENPYLEG
jgi:acyl-CoA synthetase (AMP-forming)/AMP-acid ligase II